MILFQGALLQQHLSFAVKNKYAKRAVQQCLTVHFHLFHCTHRFVLLIHQYNIVYIQSFYFKQMYEMR